MSLKLEKYEIKLLNFNENDRICDYLKKINAAVDLRPNLPELISEDLRSCDLLIINYASNLKVFDMLFNKLHTQSYRNKILIFASSLEVEVLLNQYPNFDFVVKQPELCDWNLKFLVDKINRNLQIEELEEQKIQYKKLYEKSEMYRTVLNSSPEAIIMINNDGVIIGSNDYISDMMIKQTDSYSGKRIYDLVSIGLASLLNVNIKKAKATREQINFEFKHIDYVTEYRIVPIVEDNKVGRYIIFTHNATEKDYAERALKFNSELLNTVINNLPVMAWHINHNFVLTLIAGKFDNSSLLSSFSVGEKIDVLLEKHPEFLNNVRNAFSGRINYSIDSIDGNYIETYFSVVYDATNKPKGLISLSNDISDKINTEVRLEEERKKVRFAFNVSYDSFWEIDLQNDIFSINALDGKKENFPIPNEQSINEFIDLLFEEDQPYVKRLLTLFKEGGIQNAEFHFRVKDDEGNWIWIESKAAVFDLDQITQMPAKVIGVARDVTDKIEIESEMQRSRNLLETIINSGSDYYMVLDTEMNVLTFNKLVFDHFLMFFNFYIKKNINFGVYLKDTPTSNLFRKHFEMALNGVSSKFENNYVDFVGGSYWVEHFVNPIYSLEGKVYAVNIMAKPINERKQIEEELQNYRSTLEAILDTSPVGIVLAKNNRIEWTNQNWRQMMEYDDSTAFVSFCDFCDNHTNCENCFVNTDEMTFNIDNGIELKMLTINKKSLDCLVYAKYVKNTAENKEILLTVVDITERKKDQMHREALLEATIEIEKKRNEAITLIENSARIASIGVIAGGITHEINQPLNAIRVASEGILFWNKNNNMVLPEQVTRLINKISNATLKVDDIIQHMRAYWIESSKNDSTTVNLSDSIKKALSLTLQRVQSHEVFLKIEETKTNVMVKANPLQLEIIINNLVINALQSLDSKDIKDKFIKIRTGLEDSRPYLSVSDNGIGLPDVPTDSLFDPFFSTKKQDAGTGLGLAIVKLFVNRFGAEIIASNNEFGGATFTIYFN